MLDKIVKLTSLVVFLGLLSACVSNPFYHENFMRGQVVGIDDDETVVCIGSQDGAKKGQELQVYRYVWEGATQGGIDDYRVDNVGTLQIKSVVNEHFARAIIIEGDVQKHDTVELKE